MQNALTIQQIEAIRAYALENGRAWKSALRVDWETGNYSNQELAPYLQQVRNAFGPRWLKSFRLATRIPRDAQDALNDFNYVGSVHHY